MNTDSFGFMVDLDPSSIPELQPIVGNQLKMECKVRLASSGIVCGVHAGPPKWLAALIHAGEFIVGVVKDVEHTH